MLRVRLADERGIALVMTLMVLTVLTILGASMLTYTNANGHSAQLSQGRSNAWAVAEAGVAQAFSILGNPANDANKSITLPPGACSGGVTCYTCGSTQCFKATTPGGYALWSGTLVTNPNQPFPWWIVTSTGYITNTPTGIPATKTAIVKIPITWSLTGPLNNPAWSEIMSTHPPSANGVCDETIQQGVTIASPFYVEGNLCFQNTAAVTQGPLNVKGSIWLQQPNSIIGTKNGNGNNVTYTPISEAHVGGQCQYQNNGFHACGPLQTQWHADNIYATIADTSPNLSIVPPVIDWDGWYKDASPGPYAPCNLVSSGPVPTFDTESPLPNPPAATYRNNSVATPFNLTPVTSYTCKTNAGELSWNASTNVLTIKGAIFIDGSAYIVGPTGGFTGTYTGQAALYLSGDFFMKNAIFCSALTANKKDCDMSSWNPNSNLLAIITNGDGGQPSTNMNLLDGAQYVSSIFQGAIYATDNIDTDTSSKVYGPMLGNAVNIGQSVNTVFPAINVSGFWLNTNNAVYAQPQPPVYLNG